MTTAIVDDDNLSVKRPRVTNIDNLKAYSSAPNPPASSVVRGNSSIIINAGVPTTAASIDCGHNNTTSNAVDGGGGDRHATHESSTIIAINGPEDDDANEQKWTFSLRMCESALNGTSGSVGRSSLSSIHIIQRATHDLRGKQAPEYQVLRVTEKSGQQPYAIARNIETVFKSFVRDGKMTIRFRDPSVDLAISKADPLQLQGFLQTLWATHSTPDRLTGVPTKSSLNYGTTDPHQKSMHISADRQLPSAYPASLESLRINSQRLSRIPTKALELPHLTFLDLSDNFIANLPDNFSLVLPRLKSLVLAKNRLTSLVTILAHASLHKIDVSDNLISEIPVDTNKAFSLQVFIVGGNNIRHIPVSLFTLHPSLRIFKADRNQIQSVPATLMHLPRRLQHLDLSDNLFQQSVPTVAEDINRIDFGVLSLQEMAARRYIRMRLQCELPIGLKRYLGSVAYCSECLGPYFQKHYNFIKRRNLDTAGEQIQQSADMDGTVPVEYTACSRACLKKTLAMLS